MMDSALTLEELLKKEADLQKQVGNKSCLLIGYT